jgi:nicotinate phosphoribosyltransferase
MIDDGVAIFTDLYELTMLQAYYNEGMRGTAVFDLFFRQMPERRNFVVAAGLAHVLDFLENLSFSPEAISYLSSLGMFSSNFLDYLASFRFTGTVRAIPEGTLAFPNEPLLEVEAPLPEAQLVETYLLNQITFGSLVASKGARAVLAARGRSLIDFGSRRAQGTDAALKAARVLYLAGFASTSNVLAGMRYGIPVAGTMAHSYVEAHVNEIDAFRAFLSVYPETVLLVDTYDTLAGVRNVVRLAEELGGSFQVTGIRLDSGDLTALAREARAILDENGLQRIRIVASGGLDEYAVAELLEAGAPIDAFGVGTRIVVSSDEPTLDTAYKLVAYDGRGRMKLSASKATFPGKKQVFRQREGGVMVRDVIALDGETIEGEPLLVEVMRDGQRLPAGRATLENARARASAVLNELPEPLRALTPDKSSFPVRISQSLVEAERRLRSSLLRSSLMKKMPRQ